MKINGYNVTRDSGGGIGNSVVGGTCINSEVVQCDLTEDVGWLLMYTKNPRETNKKVFFLNVTAFLKEEKKHLAKSSIKAKESRK